MDPVEGGFICRVCECRTYDIQDGFYYCTNCDHQSQEYRETACDVLPKTKSQKAQSSEKEDNVEYDEWTSWEAFNYILHGMTEELKKFDPKGIWHTYVIRLWTCYLNKSGVAFIRVTGPSDGPKLKILRNQPDKKSCDTDTKQDVDAPSCSQNDSSEVHSNDKCEEETPWPISSMNKKKAQQLREFADRLGGELKKGKGNSKPGPSAGKLTLTISRVNETSGNGPIGRNVLEWLEDIDMEANKSTKEKNMTASPLSSGSSSDSSITAITERQKRRLDYTDESEPEPNSKRLMTEATDVESIEQTKAADLLDGECSSSCIFNTEEHRQMRLKWRSSGTTKSSKWVTGKHTRSVSTVFECCSLSNHSCTSSSGSSLVMDENEESGNPDNGEGNEQQSGNSSELNSVDGDKESTVKIISIKMESDKTPDPLTKNKLLGMLHLSLLLGESKIQLSDVIRFIRGSHLSFASVTHFFPKYVELSVGDTFIETVSNEAMPTHMGQRKIAMALAKKLEIDVVPTPNMYKLIRRYCYDLNLPDEVRKHSCDVMKTYGVKNTTLLKRVACMPNFEAMAMASIVFTMKKFFGLDGRSEFVLSDTAEKLNRISLKLCKTKLFVFLDWQRHIECRKAVLHSFHYPSGERMSLESLGNPEAVLEAIVDSFKDPHRADRFRQYRGSEEHMQCIENIKNIVINFLGPLNINFIKFQGDLNPQSSTLNVVINHMKECLRETDENRPQGSNDANVNPIANDTIETLEKDFRTCSIESSVVPSKYIETLERNGYRILRKDRETFLSMKLPEGDGEEDSNEAEVFLTYESKRGLKEMTFHQLSRSTKVVILEGPCSYWVKDLTGDAKNDLILFNDDFLQLLPMNFRWLLNECAVMTEMNSRELYVELLRIEKFMRSRARSCSGNDNEE